MRAPLNTKERGAVVRTFILLLVLANLAFFAWTQYFPSGSNASSEAHLVHQQLQPEAIKLLPPDAPAPAPAAAQPEADSGTGAASTARPPATPPAAAVASAPAPAAAAKAAPAATAAPAAAPARQVCYEWGAFAMDEVGKAEARAAKLMAGARPVQRRVVDESGTWWVYIPAQTSRPLAQQKAVELRRLGVDELFIVQEDSKYRNAISLGVFRTQEAARNRLEQLRAQGVRSATVGPRDTSSVHVFLQVRVPEAAGNELQALRQEFSGTELRTCAAAAPRT